MEQKKRFKLNAVDIIILVMIVAAAGFFVYRYAIRDGSPADNTKKTYPFVMTFDNTEIANDHFENGKIKVGDMLIDKLTGAKLGEIIDIKNTDSRSYATTSDGKLVMTPRPQFSYLTITVKGVGFRPTDGGLMVDGVQLFCNKSYEIYIGDSVFWLRAFSFTLEE